MVNMDLYHRLPEYHPLKDFFRPAKTLVCASKWLQLIVESPFAVILVKTFLPPDLGVGVG